MTELRGEELLAALEAGEVRAAEPLADGSWRVHAWVKQAILELFRTSPVVEIGGQRELWPFVDKGVLTVRRFPLETKVRLVPGGSSVRRGAHVGVGCVLMPPCYLNIGAFVGAGTMIDSHALVGSCAQIGARVHLSAGAQVGGVLEPVGARPVIVEDDVLVGGQCGLYEGVLVRRGAVLAAGTILASGTVVYDVVNKAELRAGDGAPLEIPPGAVVVPGSRPASPQGPFDQWASHRGLHVACALIVKYRDEHTDAKTALEEALR